MTSYRIMKGVEARKSNSQSTQRKTQRKMHLLLLCLILSLTPVSGQSICNLSCENAGTCLVQEGAAVCMCAVNWNGTICDTCTISNCHTCSGVPALCDECDPGYRLNQENTECWPGGIPPGGIIGIQIACVIASVFVTVSLGILVYMCHKKIIKEPHEANQGSEDLEMVVQGAEESKKNTSSGSHRNFCKHCTTCALLVCIILVAVGMTGAVIATCVKQCGPVNNAPPAIMKAVQSGDELQVKKCIQEGSEVNAMDCNGETALIAASWGGNYGMVMHLINAGASIDHQDDDGQTALIKASLQNHTDVVGLLIERNANLDLQDELSETALIHATWDGNVKIVEALIAANASLDIRERFGETALVKAAYRGWVEICQMLIDAGVDVNARDIIGETALHNAAAVGSLEVVQVLIQGGADINLVDLSQNTPENVAEIHERNRVVTYLRGLEESGST